MTEIQITLLLAYVAFTALLVLALIHGRLNWLVKLGVLIVATGFYWVSYQGWQQSLGWPSSTALPDKFLLHFAVIEEPDDTQGTEGTIFLWLTDLPDDELAAEPRAYRLPYDQETHSKVESAMRRAKAGNLQLGIRRGSDDLPEVQKFKNELGDKHLDIEFHPVPDPSLPEK